MLTILKEFSLVEKEKTQTAGLSLNIQTPGENTLYEKGMEA